MTEGNENRSRDIREGRGQKHVLPQFHQQTLDVILRVMISQLRRKEIGNARNDLVQDIAQCFCYGKLPHRDGTDEQVADQEVQSVR